MQKVICYLLISICLAACLSGGQPKWVDGKSKAYPDTAYLTASGSADNPEDAKTRALANLTKIFEVRIDDVSRDESEAWMQNTEEGATQGNRQLAVRYVDAFSTKLLEGAEIVESWQDKETKQHFALAVISRTQLRNKLSSEIRKHDRYSQEKVAQADRSADPFQSAQYLYQARRSQISRAALQRDLQIVDPTGVGIRTLWSVQDLELRIDNALGKMQVVSKADYATEEGPDVELDRVLKGGIAAVGMQYSDAQARYRMEGKLEVKAPEFHDGWHWYRGALEVSLLRADNTVLATIRWPLKAPGLSKAQATVRLKSDIQSMMQSKLKEALLSYQAESSTNT